MKKIFSLIIFASLIFNKNSFAQIDKGDWLVGGNLNFTHANTTYQNGAKTSFKNLDLSANAGCFVLDRLALGIKTKYFFYKDDNTIVRNINYLDLGVFSRYYFIKTNPYYNIILQPEYSRSFGKGGGGTTNTYSILAGPVIYFNKYIALEFNIGYSIEAFKYNPAKFYTLQSGIGLQIHLTK
jgi:hypothetical protein